MTPEAGTAGALASDLCAWIDRLFPDAERGERLKRALNERFGDDARAVTDDLCREVEAVAHEFSRHLELEYVADGSLVPDTEPPGWPPPGREVERRAGSVGQVTRRPDAVGVLALDGLDPVHIAAPYLVAAFALLRGARGVVLDLRRNRGGDPGTLTLVLDWLLGGEPTHVSDVVYRDRERQWWTHRAARGPGAASRNAGQRAGRRAHVLVGRSARLPRPESGKSAGRRATDARCCRSRHPVRVSSHVRAVLPEARVRDAVTGTNWEGTGVVPDIHCDPAGALDAAIEALRPD